MHIKYTVCVTPFFSLQGVLQRGYSLFTDPHAGTPYTVPDAPDVELFRRAIEGLPLQDHPGLFGMHPNADLAFRSLQVLLD